MLAEHETLEGHPALKETDDEPEEEPSDGNEHADEDQGCEPVVVVVIVVV